MSKKGGAAAAAQLVKLIVPAGKASAQPPVGPALGARGVKAMDFAKVCVYMRHGRASLCFSSFAPLPLAGVQRKDWTSRAWHPYAVRGDGQS